jgi:plastocyanin
MTIVERLRIGVALAAALVASMSCTREHTVEGREAHRYTPTSRAITITTVPLLVKEEEKALTFLEKDFAKGGVLEGKEVYAFSPSTITVIEGDTIHFTLINPEDDAHSFVLPDLAVSMPAQTTTTATYVAKRGGVFPFVCAVQAHLPMMWGQLVVLSASSMAAK